MTLYFSTTNLVLASVDTSGCFSMNTLDLERISDLDLSLVNLDEYIPADETCLVLTGNRHAGDQTKLASLAFFASGERDIPLYISGNLFLSNFVKVYSNTEIVGINNAKLISYTKSITALLLIDRGAENISLSNFELKEARPVTLALILLGGENSNIRISDIKFLGKEALDSQGTRGIYLPKHWAKNITIIGSEFNKLEYGLQAFVPVIDLTIDHSEFSEWTHMAIYLNRGGAHSPHRRTENVRIANNYFHSAAFGSTAKQAVVITRGASRHYVKNVDIINNVVEGNGGSSVRGVSSDAHGDQILLAGVNIFKVVGNSIFRGGENGFTASNLSRNGLVSNNDIYLNDGHGVSIGSGFYEIWMDDVSNFDAGDQIVGQTSGVRAIVSAVIEETNTLKLERITGQAFRVENIDNITQSITDAGRAINTDRTKRIRFVNNRVYDNGVNSESEVAAGVLAGVFVVNSDSIEFRRNSFYDTRPERKQYLGISVTKSRNIFADSTNTVEGNPLDNSKKPDLKLTSTAWLADRVDWSL